MSEHYWVRLNKENLVFSAGHFITYDGGECERLHGHNYQVAVSVKGPLDENHYVIDFVALHGSLKEIVSDLDHHMLLPLKHPRVTVEAGPDEVTVRFEERRWIFPRCDCVLLPIPNTTTELLARHIGHQLIDRIESLCGLRLSHVRVEVDENYGQWGVCEIISET